MHPKLKLRLYEAIQKAIDVSAEGGLWDESTHDHTVDDMVKAAEIVFDTAQEAVRNYQQESMRR